MSDDDIYQEGHKPCQRCGVIVPWFELKQCDSWNLCNYCYQERMEQKKPRCEKCREIIYGAEIYSKGSMLCDNCALHEKTAPAEFSQEPGKIVERDYITPPDDPFGQKVRPPSFGVQVVSVARSSIGLFSGFFERVLVALKVKKRVELRPRARLRAVPKKAEEKGKKLGEKEIMDLIGALEKEKSKGEGKEKVKSKKKHKEFQSFLDHAKDDSEKKK
ncbi:hypothetical protein HY992_05890 [Candidatus Micrarchaeota archaeon]|nr:hypothetical protein [Candidatus Micrarchaeota archaeon]